MSGVAVVALEEKAEALVAQAKALKITDQQTYNLATQHLLAVVDLRHEIAAHHQPMKQAAYAAWQQVIAAEKKLLAGVVEAERLYKISISMFESEQRRIEAEARAQAEVEARRQAEEAREQELAQAEAAGADVEEISAMIAEPLVMAPARVEPAFQAARGITTAITWKGEVTSLAALVKAIAEGRADLHLVQPNIVAINEKARATRGTLAIAGLHFFSESVVRAARR